MRLDARMMGYRIFRLIKQSGEIFEEARQFTGQLSFLPDEDCELTEYDLEINEQIATYEKYLENPNDYGGEKLIGYIQNADGNEDELRLPQPPIPPEPPEKTRALLIVPGNTALKQNCYMQYCGGYESALSDVQSFNYTIHNSSSIFIINRLPFFKHKTIPHNFVDVQRKLQFHNIKKHLSHLLRCFKKVPSRSFVQQSEISVRQKHF